MRLISLLRKNIGTVIACFGTLLLCVITFGDLGEIATDQYWINVRNNFTSIGMMTIALTLLQVVIKQGVAEQALQRGLNTETTTRKWEEHTNLIKSCQDKYIYMPYFMQIYNARQTALRKRDFLVNNNYKSEASLMMSKNRRLKRKYNKIYTTLTVGRIKWATTEIKFNKQGQIQTLAEYRVIRAVKGLTQSVLVMASLTLLTTGLFISVNETELWQKFVKLGVYIITIAMTSVYAILKEYEKGAFCVPNELEELNLVWREFQSWEVPQWVIEELNILNKENNYGTTKLGTTVQAEPEEEQTVQQVITDS